jgi:hypothetical protein
MMLIPSFIHNTFAGGKILRKKSGDGALLARRAEFILRGPKGVGTSLSLGGPPIQIGVTAE